LHTTYFKNNFLPKLGLYTHCENSSPKIIESNFGRRVIRVIYWPRY